MKRLTLLVGPGRKEGRRGEVAVVTVVASLCQHLPVPHSITLCPVLPQYFSLPLLLANYEPALSLRHSEVLSSNGKLWFSSILTHNPVLKRIKPFRLHYFLPFSFSQLSPCCHGIIQHTRATAFCVLCHCKHYSILEFRILLRFKNPSSLQTF